MLIKLCVLCVHLLKSNFVLTIHSVKNKIQVIILVFNENHMNNNIR